jgi:hypothetical protein
LLSELKDKEDLLESLFSDVLVKEKLDEAKWISGLILGRYVYEKYSGEFVWYWW